jgi:hypothetical protein
MMIQNTAIKNRVKELYTQGVFIDSIMSKDETNTAILSCVIPRVIFDDKKAARYVKFLKLSHVGEISVGESDKILFETKPSQVVARMDEGVKEIRLKTEQLVLSSIYDKLSKIAMIRTTLNPIYVIIKNVYEGGFYKETLNNMGQKRKKYEKYLQFLCDLKIIRENNGKYSEGNYFIELRKVLEKEDEEIILNKVFGLAIRDGKTYLLNNLKLNILKPFIRIANVYYLSSILIHDMLYITKENFLREYMNAYGVKVRELTFNSQLDQLNRAGILNEGKYISGKKEILHDVMKHFELQSNFA